MFYTLFSRGKSQLLRLAVPIHILLLLISHLQEDDDLEPQSQLSSQAHQDEVEVDAEAGYASDDSVTSDDKLEKELSPIKFHGLTINQQI